MLSKEEFETNCEQTVPIKACISLINCNLFSYENLNWTIKLRPHRTPETLDVKIVE